MVVTIGHHRVTAHVLPQPQAQRRLLDQGPQIRQTPSRRATTLLTTSRRWALRCPRWHAPAPGASMRMRGAESASARSSEKAGDAADLHLHLLAALHLDEARFHTKLRDLSARGSLPPRAGLGTPNAFQRFFDHLRARLRMSASFNAASLPGVQDLINGRQRPLALHLKTRRDIRFAGKGPEPGAPRAAAPAVFIGGAACRCRR